MKWKLSIASVIVFLFKTTVFCSDGFISSAILNQALFEKIKNPGKSSENQCKHITNLLKMLCPDLKISQTNHHPNIYLQNLAKKLSIKSNCFQLSVLKKLILILTKYLQQTPCTGKNCQACQANYVFIAENGPQIKSLIDSLEKKSRWFRRFKIKKKHLLSLGLVSAPPLTWIFREPLSKVVIEPLSKFIEWNLPWLVPFLTSCLSFFSFYKFYSRPGLKKHDNTPPSTDQNQDKEKEKIRTNLFPPIESELEATRDLLEQARAHLAAISNEMDLAFDDLNLKIKTTQLKIFKENLERKRLKKQTKAEESLSEPELSEHSSISTTKAKKHRRGAMSLTGFPQRTGAAESSSSRPVFSPAGSGL